VARLSIRKIPALLIGFSFFICTSVAGQSMVEGKVTTPNQHAAAGATVALLQQKDSMLVKAVVCDSNGLFSFAKIVQGHFWLSVSLMGYTTAYQPVILNDESTGITQHISIVLEEEAATLTKVTITARKPLFEQKPDRLVINVAASAVLAGNTALDILERSPGILVDHQNNSISINGKSGVVVMINGRISHMPVTALVQLLTGMNAGNIEKIELITNPPANLDAEGNAGYINIVLKENNNTGTNGSFSITAGYAKGWITAANLAVNHRKGRLNIYGDIAYSRIRTPNTIDGRNLITNNGETTELIFAGRRTDTIPDINGRIGLDLDLTKRTVIGLLVSGYNNDYTQSEHNTTSVFKNGQLDTLIRHDNSEINHWYNYAAGLNLQHYFNEKDKLVFNADYIYYCNHQPVGYLSRYYNSSEVYLYDQRFRSTKVTPILFWIFSADYSKNLGKNASLEAGVKQTISSFTNDNGFERALRDEWIKDDSLSAKYQLKENYAAAYASLNVRLNKTIEAKIGLRYEYTNSNLGTVTNKNIIDRHYGNLFPAFSLLQRINDNNSIDISYSRRITRPTFNALAPFTYYANAYSLVTGNPALQPSISDNLKAGYNYKSWLFSIAYSYEQYAISSFQPQTDSVTSKTIVRPENFVNQQTASLIVSTPFSPFKWWTMQFNLIGVWQIINATYKGSPVRVAQVNYNLNISQRFTLPKAFSIEISGYYQSPMLRALGRTKPNGTLDFGVRKKLGGKGGSLTLNATNIFNTLFLSSYVDLPEQNLVAGIKIYYSRPALKLTYSKNFGKEKLKNKRIYSTAAEEERMRVQ